MAKKRARRARVANRTVSARRRNLPTDVTDVLLEGVLVEEVTLKERLFVDHYVVNGFNASEAYQATHPQATRGTCYTEGWKLLRRPRVRAYLNERTHAAWSKLHLSGDEVLARVAQVATFDVRCLFDFDKKKMLEPWEWPDQVQAVVKGIRPVETGGYAVVLESPLAAQRMILELIGKLKGPGDSIDALAEAIMSDIKRNTGVDPKALPPATPQGEREP